MSSTVVPTSSVTVIDDPPRTTSLIVAVMLTVSFSLKAPLAVVELKLDTVGFVASE